MIACCVLQARKERSRRCEKAECEDTLGLANLLKFTGLMIGSIWIHLGRISENPMALDLTVIANPHTDY